MYFPEQSWTVVVLPCFAVVKTLTIWFALLLFFLLRFSSILQHCSPIQFYLAFFVHFVMLLFTSLYFSDPSVSNCFFLSSLLLSHRSRISAVTYQHRDQSKWTEAWDCHKLQVSGLSYNWRGFQARGTLKDSTANSSIDKVKTSLKRQSISLSSKTRPMRSLVTSIFLYSCESWTLTAELQRRIQAMEMSCYREILPISYKNDVSNE